MSHESRRDFFKRFLPTSDHSEQESVIEQTPTKHPLNENHPPHEIPRRTFLSWMTSGISSIMLGGNPILNKLANFSQRRNPENNLTNETWELDTILKDPTRFLDSMSSIILSNSETETSPLKQKFLDNFSTDASAQPELAAHNLEVLNHVFVNLNYGSRILDFVRSAEETDVKINFQSFSSWWISFLSIKNFSLQGEDSGNQSFFEQEIDTLLKIINWCKPLMDSDNYEEQKEIYVEKGTAEIEESQFDEIVAQTWESLISGSLVQANEELQRTDKEYEVFKDLIKLIKDHFPLAIYKLKHFDFTNREGNRAYFDDETNGAFLGTLFFEAMDLIQLDDENYDWDIKNKISEFLIVLLHELAHPFDPNRKPEQDFTAIHPEDFISYNESHLEMYQSFYGKIDEDNFGPSGTEEWFLDPASPKDFGIDQLISQEQLTSFNSEIDQMIEVCRYFESTEGQTENLHGKVNMDWFFDNNANPTIGDPNPNFKNWDAVFNMDQIDFGIHGWEFSTHQESSEQVFDGVTTKISNFNQISVEHLEELKTLTNEIFNCPQDRLNMENGAYVLKEGFLKSILHIKSMYLFVFFQFFRNSKNKNLIEPGHALDINRYYFQNHIDSHLMHCMNGPVGEYLPYPSVQLDLSLDGESHVSQAIQEAYRNRNLWANKDLISWNPDVTETIEDLYHKAAQLRNKRAVLWGADTSSNNSSPEQSYSEFEVSFGKILNLDQSLFLPARG